MFQKYNQKIKIGRPLMKAEQFCTSQIGIIKSILIHSIETQTFLSLAHLRRKTILRLRS